MSYGGIPGRNTISLAHVKSPRSTWTTQGLPQLTAVCASPVYTAQAPGGSAGVLSKAGPAFHALPRSELLRFRISGTPQGARTRLGKRFLPFLVRAAQATGCLASALSQVGHVS